MVALPTSAAIAPRQHRESQGAQRIIVDLPVTDADLVFTHLDGTRLLPHSITQAWARLAQKAVYSHFQLHDARQSHAKLMLIQGAIPKIVRERLGHSSVSIILNVFSQVLPGLREAAAQGFDKVFDKVRNSGESMARSGA